MMRIVLLDRGPDGFVARYEGPALTVRAEGPTDTQALVNLRRALYKLEKDLATARQAAQRAHYKPGPLPEVIELSDPS
jgi:hypothetical protein